MTSEELIDAKLAEGIKMLDEMLVLRMQECVLVAGDLVDRPRVREAIAAEHARMLKWRDESIALIESTLLRAVGRPHH